MMAELEPIFHDDGKEAWIALGCPFKGCKHKFQVKWLAPGMVSFNKMNYHLMLMIKKHLVADHKQKPPQKPFIIIDDPEKP